MAFCTTANVAGATNRVLLRTCETVEIETPARAATSFMLAISSPRPARALRQRGAQRLRKSLRKLLRNRLRAYDSQRASCPCQEFFKRLHLDPCLP